MSGDDPSERRVAVHFGSEVFVVELSVDPTDPPTEDSLIDMARRRILNDREPDGSFRKGEILE